MDKQCNVLSNKLISLYKLSKYTMMYLVMIFSFFLFEIFNPSKASAEQYRYTFKFSYGEYVIIAEHNSNLSNNATSSDIKIIDSYSTDQSVSDYIYGEVYNEDNFINHYVNGKNSLYAFIYTHIFGDLGYDSPYANSNMLSEAQDFVKMVLLAGYDIYARVFGEKDSSNEFNTADYVNYAYLDGNSFVWGDWTQKGNDKYDFLGEDGTRFISKDKKTLFNIYGETEIDKSPTDSSTWKMKNYARYGMLVKNKSTGDYSTVYHFLSDDRNIVLLANKIKKDNNLGKVSIIKEAMEPVQKGKTGIDRYSWDITESSSGTLVNVYDNNIINAGKKKVFTFNASATTYSPEKIGVAMGGSTASNAYYIFPYADGASTTLKVYPEILNGAEVKLGDKFVVDDSVAFGGGTGMYFNYAGGLYNYFATGDATFGEFAPINYDDYKGKIVSYFAVDDTTSDKIAICYIEKSILSSDDLSNIELNLYTDAITGDIFSIANEYKMSGTLYTKGPYGINPIVAFTIPKSTFQILDENFTQSNIVSYGKMKDGTVWKSQYFEDDEALNVFNETADDNLKHNFWFDLSNSGLYNLFAKYENIYGNDLSLYIAPLAYYSKEAVEYKSNLKKYKSNDSNVRYIPFIYREGVDEIDVITGFSSPKAAITNMVKQRAKNPNTRIMLRIYDSKGTSYNGSNLANTYNIKEDDLIGPSIDITAIIEKIYKERIESEKKALEGLDALGGSFLDNQELSGNLSIFLEKVLSYMKPVVMFLILIMILYIGISSIINNQDAKARVLVKEKLGHVLIGAVAFSLIMLIFGIAVNFFNEGMGLLATAQQNSSEYFAEPMPISIDNWLANLICSVMDVFRAILEWAINNIVGKILGSKGSVLDINELICDYGGQDNITLHPFTLAEWTRYLQVYRLFLGICTVLVFIMLIRVSYNFITSNGNAQKIKEAKEAILRISVAIFAMIFGPYIIRLVLTVFNLLTSLIPLKTLNMNLMFTDASIVGTAGNLLFVWTKFKIYFMFSVRKVMIIFMLIITPFVFGMWAVSNKFRSLNLWIGELLTNGATQFVYAMVFFILVLISTNNTNDFVTLILVMVITKMADFFRDSLQGLTQKWGGINELGVAEEAVGTVKDWSKKTYSTTLKTSKNIGSKVTKAVEFLDSDKKTSWGRSLNNVGSILSRDYSKVVSKRERYINVASSYAKKSREGRAEIDVLQNKYKNAKTPEEKAVIAKQIEKTREAYRANVLVAMQADKMSGEQKGLYSSIQKKISNSSIQEASTYENKLNAIELENTIKNNSLKSEEQIKKENRINQVKKKDECANKLGDLNVMKELRKENKGSISDEKMAEKCLELSNAIKEILYNSNTINLNDTYLSEVQDQIEDEINEIVSEKNPSNSDYKNLIQYQNAIRNNSQYVTTLVRKVVTNTTYTTEKDSENRDVPKQITTDEAKDIFNGKVKERENKFKKAYGLDKS